VNEIGVAVKEGIDYKEFLDRKTEIVRNAGLEVAASELHPKLFPFQRDITRWAIHKGRAAIFADTGLGKTFMQLEWARLIGGRCLIVAPLSVARQTVREGVKIGVPVYYTRSGDDLSDGVNITNYEMVTAFNAEDFNAICLDESSILKSLDGKTRKLLTEMFAETPYRLCCTATPAPNDIAEIANHAEFLGIMSRPEMLASFFVHDQDGWRLKGHAEEPFYKWLASWGMSVRHPSDLGYSDEGYDLPPLTIAPLWVESDAVTDGALFHLGMKGIADRSRVRRATHSDRVAKAAEIVNASEDQWILWCGLNAEADAVAAAIPGAVNVQGADSLEEKQAAFETFQDGSLRVLVTKSKIGGFGMNFQNCHRMAFIGISDSWESYYQCVRRCYRFGQTEPVEALIVVSKQEAEVWENVRRKDAEATKMSERLVEHVREFERAEITDGQEREAYEEITERHDGWEMVLGDSVETMVRIADNSVGLSVFSPPFQSLYTYSPSERDLGNSKTKGEFFDHFNYIIDHLLRVTQPGRNCAVHVQQLTTTMVTHGVIGMQDFRGDVIRAFIKRGWIYHGEVCIDKDPQAQAIRTHSKGLLFVQLRKDSTWSRPALADYIVLFRKPGENVSAVHPDITNDQWIEWARPIWYGIRETETLNARDGTQEKDERHICPLQLETIERCIRLWSNKGDLVLSPFAGIGSEGYQAVKLGRRFWGCELKRSYWETACRNIQSAETIEDIPLFGDEASA
jgi:superfamily II DNA or RNA helicase